MKVIHITTSTSGGAGKACLRVSEALNEYGVTSKVIVLNKTTVADDVFEYRFKSFWLRLRNKFLFKSFILRIRELVRSERFEVLSPPISPYDLSKVIEDYNPDIVNLHWVSHYLDFKSFFSKVKKPIVWTLHDMNPFLGLCHYQLDDALIKKKFSSLDEYTKKIKLTSFQGRVHSIISPSRWLSHEAERSKAFGSRALFYSIHNAFDLKVFNSQVSKDDFSDLYSSFPINNKVFIFVAQDASCIRKGFSILLDALKQIKISLNLILVGHVNNVCDELLKHHNILNYGYVNSEQDMARLLKFSDAFILPSLEDNMPNVMIESLLCGTPVISFKVGGMMEIIVNGVNGVLSEEENSVALGEAILRYLDQGVTLTPEEIAHSMSEKVSYGNIAKAYASVYDQISGSKKD